VAFNPEGEKAWDFSEEGNDDDDIRRLDIDDGDRDEDGALVEFATTDEDFAEFAVAGLICVVYRDACLKKEKRSK